MNEVMTLWDALIAWAANGLVQTTWWQIVVVSLVLTHITIAAVTIFLHRAQAHRALELHPIPAHFFRFWLWLTSGMVTKEWVGIHRKHHAKCETKDDPHSPVAHGLKTVLLTGSELYRAEAKNPETLAKYGQGTPDDWIERNLYTRFSMSGVVLMLVVDVLLFGAIGMTVWAVQMIWIPVTAAGIINGLGHWWGYRNFEAADASTNVSPWGIVIGGEELHNNHHTYPTSAKLSVKPYEFDLGWAYIRGLEMLGLATVRKTPPLLRLGKIRPVADSKTLEALIANRYEVMAKYAAGLRAACQHELERLKEAGVTNSARLAEMRLARRWLHRDADKIPPEVKALVTHACEQNAELSKLVVMREELRSLWTRTNVSVDQLVADLQAWCQKAEQSGIAALQEFALKLRAARA
jgi:stearoyl-CoA desaturase (delta-9 desaturase)